jgi:hypothetical protein
MNIPFSFLNFRDKLPYQKMLRLTLIYEVNQDNYGSRHERFNII